ncbi:hypothetical protein FRC02_000096 [Tulasnella sp. 418]|nr:hypothetical protein FRC02_000096 [Tulasnella sp. 418]
MTMQINVGGAIICYMICPETRGRSMEAIDIIFGAVTEEERAANMQKALRMRETIGLDTEENEDPMKLKIDPEAAIPGSR